MKQNSKADGKTKLKDKQYMKELRKLQAELCHLQEWVKHKGLRVIIVFEGRDAAGKGGTIRALTERVSPRVFRVVALPVPSDRENCPQLEKYLVDGGIHFIKIWIEPSDKEQKRRFEARMEDPLRQWKLSPPPRSKLEPARDLLFQS